MDQEETEIEDHGKHMHTKQGQIFSSPEYKLQSASTMDRHRRFTEYEKFENTDNFINTSLSNLKLNHSLFPQRHSEGNSKSPVTEEVEGAVPPRYKCRWAPLPSHIDSSQICQLLCPPPGIREIMIRKGITPRNHCKENRVAIAQKSALNHAARQAALRMAPSPPMQIVKSKPESQPTRRSREGAVDFVLKNMKDAAYVPARRAKAPKPDCHKLKENFGKIPSYLIKRKIELAQEMERKLNEDRSPQLPPGYVEMDEEEKNEVITALRENKAVLEKKLGALPLVCDTPSQIRARSNMDLELRDIENAIKRFSRPHVYISLND